MESEIRNALKKDKRSSREIGESASIHEVSLRQFKRGVRGLPLEKLESLARTLGLRIVVEPLSKKK